ncbi:MAG: heterodisulfide reductase subunit A [Peptococcaceae bacterium BICA1-7]|nr:MAG: heterodisulfide reductase subunit A [Peptococcaceae bacterium BICA1-7]HBV99039.1 hydrogenase iron-sulfur subunit [Desulfotomaculum sp.]
MAKKIGVYICSGCGIGDALDIDALAKVATKEYKVPVCQKNAFFCGKEGVEVIKKDIAENEVTYVVIAGCSGRVNYDVFNFGPSVVLERVNLRERVVWTQEPDDEDTQMMAEDYLRITLAKLKNLELPEAYVIENCNKRVMVVGGGLAGMTSAVEVAKAGYEVVLVEKEDSLGGWLKRSYKIAPLNSPYTDPEDTGLEARVKEIEGNSNIKVYTSTTIEKTAGAPGMFDVTLKQGGGTLEEKVGAIILATGAVPYEPSKLGHLGYGASPNVVTQAQFEELAAKGTIARPSDGKAVQKVGFIQCAGSRDQEHLPYCSAACCVESIKQALYVKGQNSEAAVYVFYKDIRSSGQYEHFYKKAQSEGVMFIKADVTGVTDDGGNLTIEANDLLMGSPTMADELDMVVLANGMVPTTAFEDPAYGTEAQEEAACAAADAAPVPAPIIKSNILNLEYRQGPELPSLKYGFPDSHFICFPYETRRTGIYAAGSVRRPMDMSQAVGDATGAALKAVQCIEMTDKGGAVHPRSGDISFPDFQLNRCTQCKRCTEECPFGAINEDEKGNPLPNPTRCRRCGTCMGACPERIISFKNYSVPMLGNMLKSIEVPEEDEEKPRVLIFACENDAIPALDMAGINRLQYSKWVRIIPVRCLGSLNLVWINDAMSKGFDGVLLMGCKHGDDYQCHFMKGSELAGIRLSKVSETLDRLGLESERVYMTEVNVMDYDRIPKIINEFVEKIDKFGPNPMKGF